MARRLFSLLGAVLISCSADAHHSWTFGYQAGDIVEAEGVVNAVPDLSGIWVSARGGGHGRGAFLSMELPYTDAGRAVWQNYVQETDPAMACSIDYGRATGASVLPMEILQGEDVVHILYEYDHQVRRVFIDGVKPAPGTPAEAAWGCRRVVGKEIRSWWKSLAC